MCRSLLSFARLPKDLGQGRGCSVQQHRNQALSLSCLRPVLDEVAITTHAKGLNNLLEFSGMVEGVVEWTSETVNVGKPHRTQGGRRRIFFRQRGINRMAGRRHPGR